MTTYTLSDLDDSGYRTLSLDGLMILKVNCATGLGVAALQIILAAIAHTKEIVVVDDHGKVLVGDVGQLDPVA